MNIFLIGIGIVMGILLSLIIVYTIAIVVLWRNQVSLKNKCLNLEDNIAYILLDYEKKIETATREVKSYVDSRIDKSIGK